MSEIIIYDIKKIVINKGGITIVQKNGGIIKLDKEQINNIGDSSNYY